LKVSIYHLFFLFGGCCVFFLLFLGSLSILLFLDYLLEVGGASITPFPLLPFAFIDYLA